MPANFPTSAPSLSNPTSTDKQNSTTSALKHAFQHSQANDEIEAIAAKVGVSTASPANTPTANTALVSDATNQSKWSTIVTAMIAANAVTQSNVAVGSSSGPTTTSTSMVDMTDMSITFTTTGGNVLCMVVANLETSSAGAGGFMALRMDTGTDSQEVAHTMTNSGSSYTLCTFYLFTGVSAASHTFKGRWRTTTGTMTATGTRRIMAAVELKK